MSPGCHGPRPRVNVRFDLPGTRGTANAAIRGTAAALLLLAAASAAAGDLDTGMHAYHRGDYAGALGEFRPLAEQGDAAAQFALGFMYERGEGVPADPRQAALWYHEAAEQGYAAAQYNLGVMYRTGEGVPADSRQAALWYREAAEQGNAAAQYSLGVMRQTGEGVPADARQAVFWYRKAAEQGYAAAQSNLGVMYQTGEGVPADARQAVFWYHEAAVQGYAVAQSNLGAMYARGAGVPEDDVRAYAWFHLAAEQGHEEAARYRAITRKRMTSAQVAEAKALGFRLTARRECGPGGVASAPAPDDPAPPSGPSRDTVLWTQMYLALLGYAPGPPDGLPGRRTTEAVRRFQRDFALDPAGRISEELLTLLMGVADAREKEPL